MITLAPSFPSLEALADAYRTAGGTISSVTTAATPATNPTTVNCAGTPPTFFAGWTYRPTDQLTNLYKGVVDMSEVTAVQAPSQQKDYTRLDVIERELGSYEFVGAHVAVWYQRPENLATFLAVCPSGYLVFLEKYRNAGRRLRVVCLYVRGGVVRDGYGYAGAGSVFGGGNRFAVLGKLST